MAALVSMGGDLSSNSETEFTICSYMSYKVNENRSSDFRVYRSNYYEAVIDFG